MRLDEFLTDRRDEIIEAAVRKLKGRAPERDPADLRDGLPIFLDEVIRALRRKAGLRESSPLPGPSETAVQLGEKRHRGGYPIAEVAAAFGAISSAVGEVGGDERFTADEYGYFNECIDTSIATALERFWTEARASEDHAAAERLGFVAHELRNALSSARTAWTLIQNGHVGSAGRVGEVLGRALGRMKDLIEQSLAEVRLRAGASVDVAPVRIGPLLRDVEQAAVPERGVRLDVIADDSLEAMADERLLVSAIGNLVQNALKFTRDGGRVQVRAREADGRVVVEVEDQCGGLPPGKKNELFAPFVQRGADRRGLGLGLAITREAVQAQRGELEVVDKPGEGCVFWIALPRA